MTARTAIPDRRLGINHLVELASGGLGLLSLAFGLWALAAPSSFFDAIATFEPYNRHFLHDAGALQIGMGCGLLLAAARKSAAIVALGAFVAFEALHVVSHVVDRDLGGNPALDISFLVLLTVVGGTALVAACRPQGEDSQ